MSFSRIFSFLDLLHIQITLKKNLSVGFISLSIQFYFYVRILVLNISIMHNDVEPLISGGRYSYDSRWTRSATVVYVSNNEIFVGIPTIIKFHFRILIFYPLFQVTNGLSVTPRILFAYKVLLK